MIKLRRRVYGVSYLFSSLIKYQMRIKAGSDLMQRMKKSRRIVNILHIQYGRLTCYLDDRGPAFLRVPATVTHAPSDSHLYVRRCAYLDSAYREDEVLSA